MDLDTRIAVVSWAKYQDRANQYARCLNAPMHFIHRTIRGRDEKIFAPLRYILQAVDTWNILKSQKPRIIHVTNPPIFAALVVYVYCQIYNTYFILDTHPPALYSKLWGWTLPLQRSMARRALINIIDQERYQDLIVSWRGKAIIQQNPPNQETPSEVKGKRNPDKMEITVVNTFSSDEPLTIILDAAKQLPQVHFYILGNTRFAPQGIIENAPDNVTFTGYLLNQNYWNRLRNSHAVMCLTVFPFSLLAGAKDGLMVEVPLILSRQPCLVEYFTQGTIFIENSTQGVVNGIKELEQKQAELDEGISSLYKEKQRSWDIDFQQLTKIIAEAL